MGVVVLVMFLFLLFFLLVSSATSSNIPVSSQLKANTNSSVWLSPSGMFAFGFHDTSDGYAICIYMAGISERTVVWLVKEINPIFPHDVNYLLLMKDRIRLFKSRHLRGSYAIYHDIVITEEPIAGASMLDTGNFVLYNSAGGLIWQSFHYPTGTLLPGQRLQTGQELFSRASETSLERGMFRLKMQSDGNLVQYPLDTSDTGENAYYESRTYGAGNNLSLILDNDGRLYLYNGTSVSLNLTRGRRSHVEAGTLYLARVDPDGIFRLYNRSSEREGNWRAMWWSTDDKCAPKGLCGINSFCSYEDENVTCTCLPGFGDGCKEEFDVEDCRKKNSSEGYEMARMENMIWEENYFDVSNIAREEDCGRACLEDCECVVALFQYGFCQKQKAPLKYGRRSKGHHSVALFRVPLVPPVFIQAPPSPIQVSNASGFGKGILLKRNGTSYMHKYAIIGVSIGVAALVVSSIFIYYVARKGVFGSQDEESNRNVYKLVLNQRALKRYSYKKIKKITKSFAEKVGQGGYGIVYKGQLQDGQIVAVKVLTKTNDHVDEFLNEVASISKTSHVNIVNLLGFCFQKKKRALVYEFMPNKSLDKYIHNAECTLEWNKLYEIAVGVARGLEYLHRGCTTRIVHFDIKPHNILLDEDFCPKIADFGLAKLCMKKQSAISMLGTRGTIGYIAPEVYSRKFGLVSYKSDVYSYGIMLLQMAKARTNVETRSFLSSEEYFLEKIYKHVLVQSEKVYDVIKEDEEEVVKRMLMVGFWCIQTAPSDRPSMNKVVEMLEGNMQSIQIPPLPFLLSTPKQPSCLFPLITESESSTVG